MLARGVVEAAAYPLDSAENWQLPAAAVTVRDASLTPHMLKQFCFDSIGPKVPEYIWIIEEMPRNEAGKIRKNDLVKYAMKALCQ